MTNTLSRIGAFLGAFFILACVGPTGPQRDFHCLYPGDTVGVIAFHDDRRIITSCTYIVQKELECRPEIDARRLFHAGDCVVGTKDDG